MPLDPDDVADLHERRRLSSLVSVITDDDFARQPPPPELWDSLAKRIDAEATRSITVVDAPPQVITGLDSERRRRNGGSRARFFLAAAAVLVMAGLGSAIFVLSSQPAERVVARATLRQLEPLGETTASVRLITKDGASRLVVEANNMAPPPPGETYELWLIDTKVTDPRSLGVVSGSEEVHVPTSIDPATHPIVDISLEPDDGNHHHSGHSLMRGTLN